MIDKIIFVSNDSKEKFIKKFPNTKNEKKVIYNIVDKKYILHQFDNLKLRKDDLTLCYAGRLSKIKGCIRLLKIIHRLVYKDDLCIKLWMVGEDVFKKEIESLIQVYSLEDVVSLKGFQLNQYPYIKYSDIFVSPSYTELFSLVIAEALCLGKAIVATNSGGPRELLDNGIYGMLVENNNGAIYLGLKEMIINEPLRKHYTQKELIRAATFDISRIMESIDEILTV